MVVGVLEEAGVDLHLAREHGLQVVGHVVPGGISSGRSVSSASVRDDAELLLPRERPLAQRVPNVVE